MTIVEFVGLNTIMGHFGVMTVFGVGQSFALIVPRNSSGMDVTSVGRSRRSSSSPKKPDSDRVLPDRFSFDLLMNDYQR